MMCDACRATRDVLLVTCDSQGDLSRATYGTFTQTARVLWLQVMVVEVVVVVVMVVVIVLVLMMFPTTTIVAAGGHRSILQGGYVPLRSHGHRRVHD